MKQGEGTWTENGMYKERNRMLRKSHVTCGPKGKSSGAGDPKCGQGLECQRKGWRRSVGQRALTGSPPCGIVDSGKVAIRSGTGDERPWENPALSEEWTVAVWVCEPSKRSMATQSCLPRLSEGHTRPTPLLPPGLGRLAHPVMVPVTSDP